MIIIHCNNNNYHYDMIVDDSYNYIPTISVLNEVVEFLLDLISAHQQSLFKFY